VLPGQSRALAARQLNFERLAWEHIMCFDAGPEVPRFKSLDGFRDG